MMDVHIGDILQHIPEWVAAEPVLTPLEGGITNQNYRVDIGGEAFVLRIGGKGTRLLGIDRGREYTCTAIAAQLGVGAEVVRFLADQEVLVTRFISGKNLAPEDAAQPDMLPRIAQAMRTYHNGPDFPGTFSPFETVRTYHRLALEAGVAFPDTLPQVFALMERIEQAIGRDFAPKPCHNDLLASNFIDDGHAIRILDWEYAAMGDPFFDLGNFAVNQSLDKEQCEHFLRAYFGTLQSADLAHLHLMRLASDLRESFWGFLQLGISALDFDYHDYAHHHLTRFLHNVATPQFEQWLHDVGA
ncbi:MAG TPA: choline/ethanolamine kinase family protein [Ktedonobacteraceae bacterium]|nr:choline/ethanolamine kinase family protein [Ktedonobacteraceae bacterium]